MKLKLGSFFKTLGRFFATVFSVGTVDRIEARLTQVQGILAAALRVVRAVAAAAPGRTEDEIRDLADQSGTNLVSLDSKENALRDIARNQLQKKLQFIGPIDDHILNAAIELAVVALKAERKE